MCACIRQHSLSTATKQLCNRHNPNHRPNTRQRGPAHPCVPVCLIQARGKRGAFSFLHLFQRAVWQCRPCVVTHVRAARSHVLQKCTRAAHRHTYQCDADRLRQAVPAVRDVCFPQGQVQLLAPRQAQHPASRCPTRGLLAGARHEVCRQVPDMRSANWHLGDRVMITSSLKSLITGSAHSPHGGWTDCKAHGCCRRYKCDTHWQMVTKVQSATPTGKW